MSRDLYYVGDTVNLGFKIEQEGQRPALIESITVSVFGDEGEIIHEDPVTATNDVVSYTIDSTLTRHQGDYAALFTVKFNRGQIKAHRVLYSVLPRGVPPGAANLPVLNLSKTSTDHEVEGAVGSSIRIARRRNGGKEKPQVVYAAAQQKTGKRIPK